MCELSNHISKIPHTRMVAGFVRYVRQKASTFPYVRVRACAQVRAPVRTPAQPRACLTYLTYLTHPTSMRISHFCHTSTPTPHTSHQKKDGLMMEKNETPVTRVFNCTAENLADFRQLVQEWTELAGLIDALRRQNLFPGLRALQIRATAPANQLAAGVACLLQKNAATAPRGAPQAHPLTTTETAPCN